MQEIERMFDSIESRNCGTGAVGGAGFQPGNKCAGDGSKSKAKAEGKKKDVHSDWDDGDFRELDGSIEATICPLSP